ncbi:hypothetical protein ACVWYG_003163 [Pedobacter sp. UYEF25]
MQIIKSIQSRIHEVRGERVMLDFDLANLYEVETKVSNQAVKRNIKHFPGDFMFRLTKQEWESVRSQFVTAYEESTPSSQFVMMDTPQNRTGKYLPYAFTEQGIAMLSGVLKSDIAINMNIAIMKTFVAVRRIFLQPHEDNERLKEIKERIDEHDIQLNQLYDAMDNLWKDRNRIGFKIKN